MTARGVSRLLLSFAREVRAGGFGAALRRVVRYLAARSGVAQLEDVKVLGSEIQGLWIEAARLRDEVVHLQNQTANERQTSALLELEIAAARAGSDGGLQDLREDLDRRETAIRVSLSAQAEATTWLAEHYEAGGRTEPMPADRVAGRPLVSVILPVWNRDQLLPQAVASVQRQTYTNWELLVIDDGSADGSAAAMATFLEDPRVRHFREPHRGHSRARNFGLSKANGDLIAYLDSDDIWYPAFLGRMVEALGAAPDRESAYGAVLCVGWPGVGTRILNDPFDRERLREANFIPMTTFVHRRHLYERLGGFDESLTRLVDWDLVLRYTAETDPIHVQVLSGCYRFGSWSRVTNQESGALNAYLVRRKHEPRISEPLRVLYALEFFPHLSETYVTTEIAFMRRCGVDVEVWSENHPPVSCDTDVPVDRGDLSAAIARFRPHVVHAHHLYRALRYEAVVEAAGLPMTVRGHGLEFTEDRLAALSRSQTIRAVFQFPHLMPDQLGVGHSKIHGMTCCFDPDLYAPRGEKDRWLVVRTGLASPTKDMGLFVRLAARFPQHRFVLLPCLSIGYPGHLDEIRRLNESLGGPAEILENRPHAEVAAYLQRAGIYLHTHALQDPYGMPVSIAEAMAVGCHIIGRRAHAAAELIEGAGRLYDTEDEAAALLHDTTAWTDEQWRAARLVSIEHAFTRFTASHVLAPLLDRWRRLRHESREAASATR
jgi:glycosyltransferase involved in cell wall biosynthesis